MRRGRGDDGGARGGDRWLVSVTGFGWEVRGRFWPFGQNDGMGGVTVGWRVKE